MGMMAHYKSKDGKRQLTASLDPKNRVRMSYWSICGEQLGSSLVKKADGKYLRMHILEAIQINECGDAHLNYALDVARKLFADTFCPLDWEVKSVHHVVRN